MTIYQQFWAGIFNFAWDADLIYLVAFTAAIGSLLLRYRSSDRKSALLTLGVFAVSFLGLFVSGMVNSMDFPALGALLRETFMILQGMAVIRLCGMLVFRLLTPLARLQPPRILEDIVVFIAYLAWGLVRLHYAGLEISGIVTTSAIITAVVAFSMQDTLGNILGGLALQLDNSVEVGDWIKVDDIVGKVVDIRWRHTAVETRNWETVVVPNSQLMKSKFSVLGRHGEDPVQWRRWIWFNISYAVSPAQVIEIVQRALQQANIPNVATAPAPNCVLMEFAESYTRYAVRYWLTDLLADDLTDSEVRDHIYAALQRAGIQFAFPEHNIHVTKESEKHEQAKELRRAQELVDLLRKVSLFHAFRDDALHEIALKLKYAPFAKGDVITRQGAESHWLYILTKGEAEVLLETADGQRQKLSTLFPGNYFGEMGLMTGAPRAATVVAASEVECYLLDKQSFETVLIKRPELAEEISQVLVNRRYGLDSFRQDLDVQAQGQQMEQQHQDMLARIRQFFGLNSHP